MKKFYVIWILLLCHTLTAGHYTLEMERPGERTLSVVGFELDSSRTLHIYAVGAGAEREIPGSANYHIDPSGMFAYAWIIEARTRKMVWRMTVDNTRKTASWNRIFDGSVTLPAGRYEVYFSALEPSFLTLHGGFFSLGDLLHAIFLSKDNWDKASDRWRVRISPVDEIYSTSDVRKQINRLKEKALVFVCPARDGQKAVQGFSLKKNLPVTIYALGEGARGEMYDYGWIVNADTREKIWQMQEEDTRYAGGAAKNRLIKKNLTLQAGNYLVYFRLDGSHSPKKWNANPPYDPFFWGITLSPSDPASFDPSIVGKYTEKSDQVIVSLIRVGDYAHKKASFQVKDQPVKVRVYAIGEGLDDEMFDYAWITSQTNGKTVWKMTYRRTEHAGGAQKNRKIDEIITLKPDYYTLHYLTDDSHSFEEWNAAPPDDPAHWGVTLYSVNNSKNHIVLNPLPSALSHVLARLIRVGDDEHLKKQFTLPKATRIRIYCLGEGVGGEMYDYGWIEEAATHRIVWKMKYRESEHAGGARKNRMVDRIITLPPGTYNVHYQSDDSHSFRHWNAAPPADTENWGITLYKLDSLSAKGE